MWRCSAGMYFQRRSPLCSGMRPFAPRRSTDSQISAAITLGWRIAKLYSFDPEELPKAPPDNLLPMRRSLPAEQRLALELRAAAGDALRVGVELDSGELRELLALAKRIARSDSANGPFRERIKTWHIHLATMLWANDEATGKAYELGSFLSDTFNRVVLDLRKADDACTHVAGRLREVFEHNRVERVKRLLDDLQARIDPAAVRIVKSHLEEWETAVQARKPAYARRADLEPLHGQTVTWCQLVTGNKEPEAFIGHDDRARVRETMVARMLGAYRRSWKGLAFAALVMAALGFGILALINTKDLSQYSAIIALGGSLAGALGLSVTSIGLTVRKSLDAQAELLWNTALVEVICKKTLRVEALMQKSQPSRGSLVVPARLRRPRTEPSVAFLQADRVA